MSEPDGYDPTACMACRGTGSVTSGLGGEPHPVQCPWCRGSGKRIPGINAQEHPSEQPAAGSEPSEGPAPAA